MLPTDQALAAGDCESINMTRKQEKSRPKTTGRSAGAHPMIGNLSQPDSLSCVHFALVGRQRRRCQKAGESNWRIRYGSPRARVDIGCLGWRFGSSRLSHPHFPFSAVPYGAWRYCSPHARATRWRTESLTIRLNVRRVGLLVLGLSSISRSVLHQIVATPDHDRDILSQHPSSWRNVLALNVSVRCATVGVARIADRSIVRWCRTRSSRSSVCLSEWPAKSMDEAPTPFSAERGGGRIRATELDDPHLSGEVQHTRLFDNAH